MRAVCSPVTHLTTAKTGHVGLRTSLGVRFSSSLWWVANEAEERREERRGEERRGGERRRRRRSTAAYIKSNDPHLTGGE